MKKEKKVIARTKAILLKTRKFWSIYKRQKTAVFGAVIFGTLILIAVLAPFLAKTGPFQMSNQQLFPPSLEHPFGTDALGRDIYSRIIWGTRTVLYIGCVGGGLSLVIGLVVGSIAGYSGGLLDDVISRIIEIFMSIPSFITLLLVITLFGQKIQIIVLVFSLIIWPSNARIARSEVLSLKNSEFIIAVKGAGGDDRYIWFHHILPHVLPVVISNSMLQIGQVILMEAGLSFVGLGDRNAITWGQILYAGQSYLKSGWWMAIFSGLMISVLVTSINFIGSGMQLVINPRLRERN